VYSRFTIRDALIGALPAGFAARATAESAAATAAAVAAAATAAKSAAAATSLLRACFVHTEPASFEFLLVERLTGCAPGVIVGHFHEREATRTASGMIANQMHGFDTAVSREQLFELRLLRVERQVTHVKSHRTILLEGWKRRADWKRAEPILTQAEELGRIQQ
jgi:hypothetical protein